ncbi:MAG: hypothetical protein CMO55_15025 [Verrucomicrobiales bacterium]|nr:hypothetical protein [Verrucomicrobiales bacterium]
MIEPVELSRKYLSDTGGWKEMKEARSLHSAGRVDSATYEKGILEGMVRDKGKTFKTRLEIRSRIDVENHCPCFRARRDGIICAHALAVGLEFLEPTVKQEPKSQQATPKQAEEKPKLSADWPKVVEVADETAIPARLHIVIPPDLPTSWNKGRLGIGVEIETDDRRCLLKALKPKAPLFLESGEAALFRALQEITPESVPGMLSLTTENLSALFAASPDTNAFTLGKSAQLNISSSPLLLNLTRKTGLSFQANWPPDVVPLITTSGAWAISGKDLLQPVAQGIDSSLSSVLIGGLTLSPENFSPAFRELSRHFDTEEIEVRQGRVAIHVELEGSLNHLDAHLSFGYGKRSIPASENRDSVREESGVLILADRNGEEAAIAALEAAGFARRGHEGKFVLKNKEAILQFLAHGYPALQQQWSTETGERFDHALGQVEPIQTNFDFRSGGENWFAMEVGFSTPSGDTVSRQEIERLLQMGQSGKKSLSGKTAVLDTSLAENLSEILNDCDPEQLQPGTYRIDQSQAGYIRETADDLGFQTRGAVPWQTTEDSIEFYPLDPELESTLRPYQKEGVNWMQNLASRGMGGILADDMGLGKTLQTLSFLYSVGGTALVVCPSSLVYNWVSEAEKFVPELKTVGIEGPNRSDILKDNQDADIFVTSYALLRRDEDVWREWDFDVVILDEAQHIKNPEAKVSQAAHRLNGTHRFALTGTPIENSVRDLWSISQFALPGYLGSRANFTERFEKPLSSNQPSTSVQERLSRRLKPVVMRRLKQEVAKDLPEKIEQVVYCDLKSTQQEVYEKLLRESRQSILNAEGGRQRMLALTALLRLRQTCCDLRLLGMSEIEEKDASIKGDVLAELLEEALDGGHRVLIFSQFVEMLQLLVPQLAAKQIDFCYLDGQTKNRADVVKRFQEKDVPVFLISLKAGGVGLNLTGADTVIHVDPWWNPAVEAQATDRAHRIGQTRVVNSYKLITRNTVEEKILALQNRKREVTESLLSGAGEARLSEAELLSLFD